MTVYTKTGDAGTTSLFNGNRVSKSDIRIKACGDLDELSSYIGYSFSLVQDTTTKELLTSIQKDLSRIMSVISGAKLDIREIQKRTQRFEKIINKYSSKLTKLSGFILSTGNTISAWFHILRTVCRRAERTVVECKTSQPANNETVETVITYLNRLSDLFFILARVYNTDEEMFA